MASVAKFKPTAEEEEAIRRANALDLELYEFGLQVKTVSFLEFSLCLSRACLGKMFVHIYINGSKRPFFLRSLMHNSPRSKQEEEQGQRGQGGRRGRGKAHTL
jgi:hypothetical protein